MKKRMKKRFGPWRLLLAALMALAVLGGCASSSQKGTLKVGVRDDIMGFGLSLIHILPKRS